MRTKYSSWCRCSWPTCAIFPKYMVCPPLDMTEAMSEKWIIDHNKRQKQCTILHCHYLWVSLMCSQFQNSLQRHASGTQHYQWKLTHPPVCAMEYLMSLLCQVAFSQTHLCFRNACLLSCQVIHPYCLIWVNNDAFLLRRQSAKIRCHSIFNRVLVAT